MNTAQTPFNEQSVESLSLTETVRAARRYKNVIEGGIPDEYILGRVSNSASLLYDVASEVDTEPAEEIKDNRVLKLLREASAFTYYCIPSGQWFHIGDYVLLDGNPIHKWDIRDLIHRASQSAFGDMMEGTTKVDTSVQSALEIPAVDRIDDDAPRLYVDNIDRLWQCLGQQDIENKIFDGKSTRLRFDKLNIYQKDGYFVRHVDHAAPGVIGTLVVLLHDFPYEGGAFRVGNEVRVTSQPDQASGCTPIAFYPDVPHSVERVTSGHRVSLSFSILRTDAWTRSALNTYQDAIDGKYKTLLTAMKRLLKLYPRAGVLLGHKYAVFETDEKGKDQPVMAAIHMLRDRGVLDFEVHSAIVQHSEQGEREGSTQTRDVKVYRCNPADWNYFGGITLEKPPPVSESVPIVHFGDIYGDVLHEHHDPGCEYAGNNAEPEVVNNVYFSRVVLLTKP